MERFAKDSLTQGSSFTTCLVMFGEKYFLQNFTDSGKLIKEGEMHAPDKIFVYEAQEIMRKFVKKVEKIGNGFLQCNFSLTKLDLRNVKSVKIIRER